MLYWTSILPLPLSSLTNYSRLISRNNDFNIHIEIFFHDNLQWRFSIAREASSLHSPITIVSLALTPWTILPPQQAVTQILVSSFLSIGIPLYFSLTIQKKQLIYQLINALTKIMFMLLELSGFFDMPWNNFVQNSSRKHNRQGPARSDLYCIKICCKETNVVPSPPAPINAATTPP